MSQKPRVSLPQLECLWKFLNGHKDIATGYNKCTTSRETSKRLWKAIALHLNAIENGAKKNSREWLKYWNNYKFKLKLKVESALKSQKSDKRGPIDWKFLPEIEKKFLLILGKKYNSLFHVGMETFGQDLSDNSHDSVLEPKTVQKVKVESITPTANPRTSHFDPVSQTSSVFQKIFVDENSGDSSEINGQTYSSPNKLGKYIVLKREPSSNTAATNTMSNESLQKASVKESKRESTVWPERQNASQRPRRRQLFQRGTPLGLDRTLSMIVRASQRKTIAMERLLQEVIGIKKLLQARLPPPVRLESKEF